MSGNRLGQILQDGGYAAGTMIFECNTPGIARLLAACDLDFVVFDMEHSGVDLADSQPPERIQPVVTAFERAELAGVNA